MYVPQAAGGTTHGNNVENGVQKLIDAEDKTECPGLG